MSRVNVLDHGFVELVDVMGDDQAIVDAARVSIAGEGVQPKTSNEALIRYLYRNRHTTPFEMVVFKFRAKMPIFVARQWVRHRMASINEMSARYSELPEEFYLPEPDVINLQADKNKQGRSDVVVPEADGVRVVMSGSAQAAFASYREFLDLGVARELARINLPLSTYTQWIWKSDLHNLFHFLSLRLDPHAQYEIRVYAEAMAEMVAAKVPIAWSAFEDYRRNAMMLTRWDVDVLRTMLRRFVPDGPLDHVFDNDDFPTTREANEFRAKLEKLLTV